MSHDLFPAMINDWKKWGKTFPFYWVQLANYMDTLRGSPFGKVCGRKFVKPKRNTFFISHTGQAVIIDIGEAKDIHPKNKQEVGRRLLACPS